MNKILEVKNLSNKIINVDEFSLYENEIVSIIGRSGSGKTTFAKILVKLLPSNGQIMYINKDINEYSRLNLARIVTYINQDYNSSLDPTLSVREILKEPLEIHNLDTNKINNILENVGLDNTYLDKYPNQLSQGQKQRIVIARSLLLEPKIIICDEITSSLDVIVQARIINLLKSIQEKTNISIIFISHNHQLVKHISNRIYEIKNGNLV